MRRGFRFSDGATVTAFDFKYALERILDPRRLDAYSASLFQDIVGADAILQSRTRKLSGVTASGNRLVIRLVRASYDLPLRMTWVCAVERDLPVTSEGVAAPIVGAGPYYVSRYVPQHDLVLTRNRYYGGSRRHHVNRIHIRLDVPGDQIVPMVESGALDVGDCCSNRAELIALKNRYRVNRSRFFVKPRFQFSYLVFNMRAGIFHGNARLRRSVNYALDREAIVDSIGFRPLKVNTPSSHFIPPGIPGRSKGDVYPRHHPRLVKARQLASGHRRDGKAVLLVAQPFLEVANVIVSNLAAIGIHVTVKAADPVKVMTESWSGWDMGWNGWIYDYPDPYDGVNLLFHGREVGNKAHLNVSGMNIPRYNKMMDRAAAKPLGPGRWRAYSRLEHELMAKVAPIAVFRNVNRAILISDHVGCISFTAGFDGAELNLAAACLKR